MKQITPQPLWINGQEINAVILNTYSTYVLLGSSATFTYSLHDSNKDQLMSGTLVMSGEDYTKWNSDDNYAWDWVAAKLNLTIIGDYAPPAPELPTEEVLTENNI